MIFEHPDAVLRLRLKNKTPCCTLCRHFKPYANHVSGGGWCTYFNHPPGHPGVTDNVCEKFLDNPP